jgi:hypothetical protein
LSAFFGVFNNVDVASRAGALLLCSALWLVSIRRRRMIVAILVLAAS